MADRDKILRFFRSSGDEELAAKLLDLAENVQKTRKCQPILNDMKLQVSLNLVNSIKYN